MCMCALRWGGWWCCGVGVGRERERIGYDFHGNDLFYTLYHVNCYISSTTSLKNREENH